MILIYVFSGENAEKFFNIDYIQFHFKICYLLYFKQDHSKFERFLDDLKKRIKPQEVNVFGIDDILIQNNEFIINEPKSNYQQSTFSIYYKEIEKPSDNYKLNGTLIDYFKFLIEYAKNNEDPIFRINLNEAITIDLSNCPQPLFSILYYIALKYYEESEFQNFNVIYWDKAMNTPYFLPIQFLDATSQIFLDLIAEGNSTIKELQQSYSQNKNLDKIVSQPFVSKYISQLLKQNFIKEEWLEGLKHFYLSEHGSIHASSTLNLRLTKKSIEERLQYQIYSTPDLIQKLIVSFLNKDEEMVNTHLDELLFRDDLSTTNILTIINKLKGYHSEKLKALLEKGLKLDSSSSELLSKLAQYYFEENDYSKAFKLCKQAIKVDPDSPLAWELLGKLTLDEDIKL
ncbi:MAG: tetratricopeptide repeat protein [Candidatus Helarchaeota archaeon]